MLNQEGKCWDRSGTVVETMGHNSYIWLKSRLGTPDMSKQAVPTPI
jgi:hypothetical protein